MTRLVENELKGDRQLWLIAGIFFAEECWEDYEIEDGLRLWENSIAEIQKHEYWANGKHEGDCTQVPATCSRCMVEEFTDKARGLIAKHLENDRPS